MDAARLGCLLLACGSSTPSGTVGDAGADVGVQTCRDDSDCAANTACVQGSCQAIGQESGAGRLQMSDPELDFGAPLLGVPVPKTIRATNVGEGRLLLSELVIDEPGENPEYSSTPRAGKMGVTLEPGDALPIVVSLLATDGESDLASLCLHSNDPIEPIQCTELKSEIKGDAVLCALIPDPDAPSPIDSCSLAEETLVFPVVTIGESATQRVTYYNGGSENRPIVIDSSEDVYVSTADGDESFTVALYADDSLTTSVTDPVLLAPADSSGKEQPPRVVALVTFSPIAPRTSEPELCVRYQGEEQELVTCMDIQAPTVGCVLGTVDIDGNEDNGCECAVTEEIDNGIDDDCDGTVDEGNNTCGGVRELSANRGDPCDSLGDTDQCLDDAVVCTGLNETNCVDLTSDTVESCNGRDDDCDGTIDNGGNACGGACELASLPGAACAFDGEFDSCLDDRAVCVGRNDTLCGNAGTDADGDLYSLGPTSCGGDCDDDNDSVYPDASEVCNDKDDDCDDVVDEGSNACGGACALEHEPAAPCDAEEDTDGCQDDHYECVGLNDMHCVDSGADGDGDGYSATDLVGCSADCDDSEASIHAGAEEQCNGTDDDCDGVADEGLPVISCDSPDDQDDCTDDVLVCLTAELTACPDVDTDSDNDGYSATGGLCQVDCDDADAEVSPGQDEALNGIDDDCDGSIDEGDNACGGVATLVDAPGTACDAGSDNDTCNDDTTVCDGLNATLCTDIDNDGDNDGLSSCIDCNDGDASVFPGATEVCDGSDNNCDGTIDEGSNGCGGVCPIAAPGAACDSTDSDSCSDDVVVCDASGLTSHCQDVDTDSDNDGFSACEDCNDSNSAVRPGATETCNAIDDDCDGSIDEGSSVVGTACPTYRPDGNGFIGDWLTLGAFAVGGGATTVTPFITSQENEGSSAVLAELDARSGVSQAGKTWQEHHGLTLPAGCAGARADVQCNRSHGSLGINLSCDYSSPPQADGVARGAAAYAFAYVHYSGSTARSVKVKFGSDDNARVWLNGTRIKEQLTGQCWDQDQFVSSTTTLNPGTNRLLIRVGDGGSGQWGFILRLFDATTDAAITDLTISLVEPP